MNRIFSTHDVAQICNTHYTTVINWVEGGRLKAYMTPGGHRRIEEADLLFFLNKYGMPVPEQLKKLKKVILIVDDDLEALEEYKDALDGLGAELVLAHDGFEAGMMVYKKKPDLILLDFKMPGMNGFEVCEFLNKEKETADIPVFAITALTSQEDILRINKCGVTQYLPKPIDIRRLEHLIKQTLGVTGV